MPLHCFDAIFKSQNANFSRTLHRTALGELTALVRPPSWWGGDSLPLPKNSSPALGPSCLALSTSTFYSRAPPMLPGNGSNGFWAWYQTIQQATLSHKIVRRYGIKYSIKIAMLFVLINADRHQPQAIYLTRLRDEKSICGRRIDLSADFINDNNAATCPISYCKFIDRFRSSSPLSALFVVSWNQFHSQQHYTHCLNTHASLITAFSYTSTYN